MQKLIVMQGVPGSGKSTKARWLAAQDNSTVIVSTDDLLYDENGEYKFDKKLHGERHRRTQDKAGHLLRLGLSVVVDNTNIKNYEARPYIQAALGVGAEVEFVRCDGGFKTIHGVPDETIQRMREGMEELSVEAAFWAVAPWEKPRFKRGKDFKVGDTFGILAGDFPITAIQEKTDSDGEKGRVLVLDRGEERGLDEFFVGDDEIYRRNGDVWQLHN